MVVKIGVWGRKMKREIASVTYILTHVDNKNELYFHVLFVFIIKKIL